MKSFLYKNYSPSISEPKISKIYMSLGLKSSISRFKSGLRGVNHKSKKVRQPKLLDIRPKYNTSIHKIEVYLEFSLPELKVFIVQ